MAYHRLLCLHTQKTVCLQEKWLSMWRRHKAAHSRREWKQCKGISQHTVVLCLKWPREHILHIPDLITTGQKAKKWGISLSAVSGISKPNELHLLQENAHKCTSILNQNPSMHQLRSIRPTVTKKNSDVTLHFVFICYISIIYLSSLLFRVHLKKNKPICIGELDETARNGRSEKKKNWLRNSEAYRRSQCCWGRWEGW